MLRATLRLLDRRLNYVLLVLGIITSVGAFAAYREFAHLVERFPAAEEEQRRFVAQIEINEQVEAEIEGIAERLKASRVIVFQFTNSTQDLTGIPWVYNVPTFVHVGNGVTWQEAWSRPVPLSSYTPLMRRMWGRGRPACVLRDITDPDISPTAASRMEARGIKRSLLCPVMTSAGNAVGMLSAEFMSRDEDLPPEAAALLEAAAARIYSALSSVRPSRSRVASLLR
jgi:hypothetical protein